MMTSGRRHDINRQSRYIGYGAVLHSCNITVAHQCDGIPVNADNTMHHIPTLFDPCQYHVTDMQFCRFDEVDTLLATDNERQHAISLHREGDAHAFIHEVNGTTDDIIIGYVCHRF